MPLLLIQLSVIVAVIADPPSAEDAGAQTRAVTDYMRVAAARADMKRRHKDKGS